MLKKISPTQTLSVQTLKQAGVLPDRGAAWPPPARLVPSEKAPDVPPALLVVRPGPTPGGLELAGLTPDLVVPLERLPFHRSPGRWHFLCPGCGLGKGVLLEVPADGPPVAAALGWACRNCARGMPAGTPPWSVAWPLTPTQRLKRALEKATEADQRRPGEERHHWRKRTRRASLARRKAEAQADQEAARLARRLGV